MIPKKIHYCWFGRNPKPALFQRCIASWKKYCPDYKIIEWNEDNFDLNCCDYVREAYDAKKWAFVTDYARLKIVHDQGGIYLDTDVEVVRSLDDLLGDDAFFGLEDTGSIATGLGFGAEAGNPVVAAMLRDYDGVHFQKSDGSYDLTTCPVRNTASIAHLLPEEIREVTRIPGAVIYPPEWFCPLSADGSQMRKTSNTHSIHWYSATWLNDDQKVVHEYRLFKNKCERLMGKRLGGYAARFVYLFFPKKREVLKRM